MRKLSNTTGFDGYGETSGENGDSSEAFTGKDFYESLISRANTTPFLLIFKQYNFPISSYNRKMTCPFKSHKGGRENSASFYFYEHTNTYFCFGCRQGSTVCDFVSRVDNISLIQAAQKIVSIFKQEIDEDSILKHEDLSLKLELMLDFANTVREFRQSYSDEKDQVYIEAMCAVYDECYYKHKFLSNDAITRITNQFKKEICLYEKVFKSHG